MAEMKFKTVADMAELLSLSTKTVYRLCKEQKIPHHRVGGVIRFSEANVRTLLQETSVEVAAEELTPVGRHRGP